jgi:hypothetical protein
MNMPGFEAESSLGPTMGIYCGKAVFGRRGTGEVLPMQDFLASSILSQNLNFGFLGLPLSRKIVCCNRERDCTTYIVAKSDICGCLGETDRLVCRSRF